jgi:hypothetical protein
LGATE